MINFKSIPFIRLLFPYVLGIAVSIQTGIFIHIHLLTLTAFLAVAITYLFQRFYKKQNRVKKVLYIISVNVFLFLLANVSLFQYQDINRASHYSKWLSNHTQRCYVSVNDIPVKTTAYTKLSVEVQLIENQNAWNPVSGKTIIYLSDTTAQSYRVGELLLLNGKFTSPLPPQNPHEFNYKQYLANRNIFHIVYAKKTQLLQSPDFLHRLPLNRFGLQIKEKVIRVLRNSGLSPDAFSVCAALLVGYDDEINNEVMQSFSHSGTLHVLSVSGMHTGVLFAVFMFLFNIFDKHQRYKRTRCITVVSALVFFVFITGFTPAVLRAAVMLSLVVIGQAFYKQNNSFNTLFLSAFILLLFNPLLVNDVGFILSYAAVFGIMYVYPLLSQRFYFENTMLQKINSLTLMSVAATLFTLPVSLFYFHQFPTWFVLSNLVIIPLSTILLLLTLALVCCSSVAWLAGILVYGMNFINEVMLWFAQLTDHPGVGYIDHISFSLTDLWFLSALILFGLLLVQNKQYKTAMMGLLLLFMWQVHGLFQTYQQGKENELLVFYVKKKPVFLLRNGYDVYLKQNGLTPKEQERFLKPYLLTLPHYHLTQGSANCWSLGSQHILHYDSAHRRHAAEPLTRYVIVSYDTPVDKEVLNKNTALVIADCSNSTNFVKKLKQRCALADVAFYSVKQQGALRVSL